MAIDQADQLDLAQCAFIKGLQREPQQPQLLRLRAGLEEARQAVLLADAPDVVQQLSCSLPVVIENEGWEETAEEVDDMFVPDAEVWRRPTSGTANPRGGNDPYISEEGHNILDVRFYESYSLAGEPASYAAIAKELEGIPGVVTHGLMLGCAGTAIIAVPDGQPNMVELKPPAQYGRAS